ncbi:MAG: carbohydrate kinase family protein [Anaerolineae bacterium]|nr:carbohydrate kinase family protein [Anaerolineae bacterium]
MSNVLVSGLINIETTLKMDSFPIHYQPVRYPFFGVNSTVSGVGLNISKALTTLGDDVHFQSIIGRDLSGSLVTETLTALGLPTTWIVRGVDATAQSIILYDPTGARMINVDLKDIQDTAYPPDLYASAIAGCEAAVLCNINFSRPFLSQARAAGVLVATDVHAISDLDDPYNCDFMAHADILFMSDAQLPATPEEWARAVQGAFNTPLLVIGLGEHGALLSVRADDHLSRYPAIKTRAVVNTIGAGDALFSSFLHFYLKTKNPYTALHKAMIFASYKIGTTGAAEGFLTESELDSWDRSSYPLPPLR